MQKRNWERGATAVEYGIFVAFIAAVVITGVAALGIGTTGLFVLPPDIFTHANP
ncbi:Flp family type IVb pilin [Propionicimonas sp.]|uniref:Flp family type IVb pilin n=1 Tax=Propionicimonas sp. TaxID=1955623 RepID=UPI0039E42A1D